jgi:hypothetical protein
MDADVILPSTEGGFRRIYEQTVFEDVDMVDAAAPDPEETVMEARPQSPAGEEQHFAGQTRASLPMPNPLSSDIQVYPCPRFIVGVDFGTTFSTIAFLRMESETDKDLLTASDIRCIDHYPDKPPLMQAAAFKDVTTVPSESWYIMNDTTAHRQIAGLKPHPELAREDDESSGLDDEEVVLTSGQSDSENERPPAQEKKKLINQAPVWGWGVQRRLAQAIEPGQKSRHMARSKLLLDEGERTQNLRKEAASALKALRIAKLARRPVDVIADYLALLFKHAKERLTSMHGLQEATPVEFVLCVPTVWTEKASRTMQEAMARAIETARLGHLEEECVKDLFIVAEPEAAAAFALADSRYSTRVKAGETFLLVDGGGGTVDAIVYEVVQTDPVRLKEVVPSDGVTSGSSFLNDEFRKLLKERLEGVELIGHSKPVESIIETAVLEWENEQKRTIDITNRRQGFDSVKIEGLQADPSRLFHEGQLSLTRPEVKRMFKPLLQDVARLVRKQLQQAKEARHNVQKVILIGGFGESPSLRGHLQNVLQRERNILGEPIELDSPEYVDSAVARGAVLRALNKANGPERYTRTSYGVLSSDLFDKEKPEHQGLRGRMDKADGQLYIKGTIEWVIFKVRISYWSRNMQKRLTTQ